MNVGSAGLLAARAASSAGAPDGRLRQTSSSFVLSNAARPLPPTPASLAVPTSSSFPSAAKTTGTAASGNSAAATAASAAGSTAAISAGFSATAASASPAAFLGTEEDDGELNLLQVTEFAENKSALGTAAVNGNILFIVLPALGFGFALVSIGATIFFETGAGQARGSAWKGASDSPGASPFQRPGAMRGPSPGGNGAGTAAAAAGLLHAGAGAGTRYPRPLPNRQALPGPPPEAGGTPFFDSPKLAWPQTELAPGEVEVMVPLTTQGQIIGLNLSEDDLTITSFAEPTAMRYGFQIGDKIVAVNGMLVNSEEEFLLRLKGARSRNVSFGEPILFRVFRTTGPPSQSPMEWLGTWEYQFQDATGNAGPIQRFKIRRELHEIVFEQEIPDGMVSGVLLPREGNLAEAQLRLQDGRPYGSILLRLAGKEVLVSRMKPEGALTYGAEVAANKVSGPASRRKKGGCLC